jgi:hypothetical protein
LTNEEFINALLPYAQKAQSQFGVFVSVTISQACWESGYGRYQGAVVQDDHNYFGVKYDGVHDPELNISQGSKVGDGTGYYTHYDNMGDSCIDHGYFLLHNSRYPDGGVFTATDGKTQLQRIMDAGYAEQAYYDGACGVIDTYNLTQYDSGGGNGDESGQKVENAVQWMINIANDDTHGYDQDSRWGPDYDCASFVISGYEQAGIPLKTNGATYTGDLKAVALNTGFKVVDWGNDSSKLVRGDIILNEVHHTCCYIGDGKIVQASQNELGGARGGQTGDQTGKEIYVRSYYVYAQGWDCVLRYGDGASGNGGNTGGANAGEVYAKLQKTPYNTKELSAEQVTFLKTLSFNDTVKMKFSFNHNKRQIGVNYLGNKLTFDNLGYKIKDVRNDGLLILATDGNVCYKYVNAKYITADTTK